jgi:hypothetical protein
MGREGAWAHVRVRVEVAELLSALLEQQPARLYLSHIISSMKQDFTVALTLTSAPA